MRSFRVTVATCSSCGRLRKATTVMAAATISTTMPITTKRRLRDMFMFSLSRAQTRDHRRHAEHGRHATLLASFVAVPPLIPRLRAG